MRDATIRKVSIYALSVFALSALFFVLTSQIMKSGASAATVTCDQTFNNAQVSALQTAVATSSSAGQIICLSPGTYTSLSFSGTHTSEVTIMPDPAASGRVTASGINVTGSYIKVKNFYSTNGLNFLYPATHSTADHNDVTSPPGGYGISVSCNGVTQPGCTYIAITNNRVHDLTGTPGSGSNYGDDGDAIRLDGWSNVQVTGNEITRVYQVNGAMSGHTDCLQSFNNYLNSGHDLLYDHNYVHDTNCQEFFLKDGDISPNVTITNNLMLRNTGGASLGLADIAIAENTRNLIMRNNTAIGGGGSYTNPVGSTTSPTSFIDHNVFDQFNLASAGYAMTENNNIYTGNNQWSFTIDSTSKKNFTPIYRCGSSCGDGTAANDDYRIVTNPTGVGVDWQPADYTYGPAAVDASGSAKSPDFNNDGTVDIYDLSIFLNEWGKNTALQDLDSNGIVNHADLQLLKVAWS